MDWGERIRWISERYEDGSRRALGRTVGVSGQAVSAWVRGETVPSGQALAAIATAYPEVRPRWLLTGQGRPTLPGGNGRPHRGDGGEPGSRTPATDGADPRRSAYEAGRRDAVLEIRQMLGRYSGLPVTDGRGVTISRPMNGGALRGTHVSAGAGDADS